jgi:hydrogenase/urease accessory protein HupE
VQRLIVCFFALLMIGTSRADDIRLGLIDITETSHSQPYTYNVVTKLPVITREDIPLTTVFPNDCVANLTINLNSLNTKNHQYRLVCETSLSGKSLDLQFLSGNDYAIVIKYTSIEKVETIQKASSDRPLIVLVKRSTNVFFDYTLLGIKHILVGWDHLCFVLLVVLLIGINKNLLFAITGFTLAHSVTLVTSVLGIFTLPIVAVETSITLSIVFLAREIIKILRDSNYISLTKEHPFIITSLFGLLHGFGFASVLLDLSFPQTQVFQAVFGFNLGVELGQLLFISSLILLARLSPTRILKHCQFFLTLGIGGVAGFWFITRLLSL